ncbi:hypothetical protein [Elioraea rosea]|uniref:hypothetical protein n=1 Tax=Elioraea rosea TaxID=2492390 RepID=UPI00118450E9|nr:hypothetical protein [Elioraea rosea]
MLRTAMLGLVASATLTTASPATEYTLFSNLCLPAASGVTAQACASSALLNLPQGWLAGDGAVALLTTVPLRDAPRDRIVAALLSYGLAVLELVPAVLAEDGGEPEAMAEPDLAAGMLRALVALKRVAGAGIVVGIGFGPGAPAAVAALSEDLARRELGAAGERFSAGLGFGEGPPAIVRNGATSPQLRLASVCEALGAAGYVAWAEACYPALIDRPRPAAPMTARLSR